MRGQTRLADEEMARIEALRQTLKETNHELAEVNASVGEMCHRRDELVRQVHRLAGEIRGLEAEAALRIEVR